MSYSVVILSKNPENCAACVNSVFLREPNLPEKRVVVVDDGARDQAEPYCPKITWVAGEKPFVFARNANIGIRRAFEDEETQGVILLNDDALLVSDRGFTNLSSMARAYPGYGLLSPSTNNIGNMNQLYQQQGSIREEPRMLCFVAIYIPVRTWQIVGELDERFVGYGCDDDDYSLRVRLAGLKLGVWDGCFVDHAHLKSTFRGDAYAGGDYRPNLELFKAKWGHDNHGG